MASALPAPSTSSPSATWPGTPARATATPSACCCRSSAARCASRWTGWPCAISLPSMCCSSSRISRRSAAVPPGPAISGLPPSAHLPASSAAAIQPMSNGAATSGPSRRRSPCRQPVGWLTQDGNGGHAWPCPTGRPARGRREYALLLFLYNTGARVSEATQLKVRDLQIGRGNGGHDLATLHGKGGKTRQCPLWPETERVLAGEIIGRAADDAVFVSRLGKPFTRFGVYRLIERCAARVPELAGQNDNPARDPAHDGLPPGSRRRGHQHRPRLARPRLDQHHQHLCRNRPHAESQRRRSLRGGSASSPVAHGRRTRT